MSEGLRSGLRWWPLGVAAIVLDQLTKEWILRTFALHESRYVLPVFDIVHARNYGAAFSFLDIPGGLQRWLFTAFALAVTLGILWWLKRLDAATQKLQSAGLMLIASGALGNVIDRVRHGNVVDFIAVHWEKAYFPAFNVADSCITIGAVLILLDALLDSRRAAKAGGTGK
ncbi:MAG: signal peptidase II [Steroidobacteraceae bacterium]